MATGNSRPGRIGGIGARDIIIALLSAAFGPKVAASVATVVGTLCG